MEQIRGVSPTSSTPLACISVRTASPARSTKSTSVRSTTVRRPEVVEDAVRQHCSSSLTQAPARRPSSFRRNSVALSCSVILSMADPVFRTARNLPELEYQTDSEDGPIRVLLGNAQITSPGYTGVLEAPRLSTR